jgi:uncharacterized protein
MPFLAGCGRREHRRVTAIHELSTEQCERLLRRGIFGRLGMTTAHGPEIVPANYAVRDGAVVVRTTSSGTLAKYGDGARLVFEVDHVEEDRWRGWSVAVRGRGRLVAIPANESQPPEARPMPWADGDRDCELYLTWDEVTGRQLGSSWNPETAMYSRRPVR